MKPSVLSIVLLLPVLGAPLATAAPPTPNAAAAPPIEPGITDTQAGKPPQACDELSDRMATLPVSGAAAALADCDTALGKLSDALELWRDVASSAPTAALRDDAARHAATLERQLTRVVIRVRGAARPDLVVTLNGKPVGRDGVNEHHIDDYIDHYIAPGTLVVVAGSPAIETWTHTYEAKPGAVLEIEIPVVVPHDTTHERTLTRVVSLSVVGAGAIAFGVGVAFGGVAYADWQSASDRCGGTTDHCKTSGFIGAQRDLDSARSAATVSTWAIGAGSLVAVTGLLVYFSARHAEPGAEHVSRWRAAPLADSQTVGITLSRSLP